MKKLKKTDGSLQPGVTNVTDDDLMCDYLDDNRGNLAFRRVVPKPLRPFILNSVGKPRTEWRETLSTTDRRTAVMACRIRTLETERELEQAERNRLAYIALASRSPDAIASDIARGEAQEEEHLRSLAVLGADEADFEQLETIRQAVIKKLSKPRSEMTTAEAALRSLIPDDDFDPPEVQAARARKIQREWDEGAAEFSAEFAAARDGTSRPAAYPSILTMYADYAAEAPLKPATNKRWKPVLARLIAHLGHDDASRVTKTDAISWKDALLSEVGPDGKVLRGNKTIREVFLAAAKATFQWGAENARIVENPFSKVTVRVRKRRRLRDPDFTEDEGLLILRAALLPQSPRLSPEHALARRWVPWMCAYTGARVNEITQMRAEDILQIKGAWAARITPEAGSTKNDEARIVPLHTHLVEQGFPAIALAKGKGPLFYDPTRARGGAESNPHYKKTGERLAAWVRSIGVDDPEVQPNHGWRHLFKTRAKNAGMDLGAREAIPGHEPGTEGRRYGVNDMPFLVRELEKLPRFEV